MYEQGFRIWPKYGEQFAFMTFFVPIVRGSFIETENGSLQLANFLPPLHQNKLPWQFQIHFNLKKKKKNLFTMVVETHL